MRFDGRCAGLEALDDLARPLMRTEPDVLVEVRDQVLVVTINRPEARNSINLAVTEAIAAAMDRLDDDDALGVGVITGAAGGFSAGMDLKAFSKGEVPWSAERGFAGIVQRPSKKPLIAAVEGFAVAGGLEIALACDLIVAARDAQLGLPEVKRSIVAAGGALLRLPRRIPYGVALELALLGDAISAERAEAIGLVNRAVEPGTALTQALELADRINANGPLAVAATKDVLESQFDWSTAEFWERQGAAVGHVFTSEDAQEGARAFAEKRDPVWARR